MRTALTTRLARLLLWGTLGSLSPLVAAQDSDESIGSQEAVEPGQDSDEVKDAEPQVDSEASEIDTESAETESEEPEIDSESAVPVAVEPAPATELEPAPEPDDSETRVDLTGALRALQVGIERRGASDLEG